MKIEFDIPDEILQTTVKEAVMRQINALILRTAELQVADMRSTIEPVVATYLKEHLTDEKLKTLVDKAAFEVIKDRLGEI